MRGFARNYANNKARGDDQADKDNQVGEDNQTNEADDSFFLGEPASMTDICLGLVTFGALVGGAFLTVRNPSVGIPMFAGAGAFGGYMAYKSAMDPWATPVTTALETWDDISTAILLFLPFAMVLISASDKLAPFIIGNEGMSPVLNDLHRTKYWAAEQSLADRAFGA